jgi:hypothetical protein
MSPWRRGPCSNPVDPHRPSDVFDLLLAQIVEGKGQPIADVIVDRIGDKHPAGVGQGFDPRRDIDAVALDDHVAEIDADAQLDTIVRRDACVALGHRLLHRDRAADRIDDAGEPHQQAVAGGLDDAAMVLGDLRIEELAAQCPEAFERSSVPIRREYPATSAARMAARRRVVAIY